MLVPKIANIKLLAQPVSASRIVASLTRADELVVVGEVKDRSQNPNPMNPMNPLNL